MRTNDDNAYVYALMDSRKPGPFKYGRFKFAFEPFYIGKGHGKRHEIHVKFAQHGHDHYNRFKFNKIRKILGGGFSVETRIVKQDLSDSAALSLEIRLISLIGRADLKLGPLVNLTNGGDGVTGNKWSKKTRNAHAQRIAERTVAEQNKLKRSIRKALSDKTPEEKALQVKNWRASMAKRTAQDEAIRLQKFRASLASKTEQEMRELAKKRGEAIRRGHAKRKLARNFEEEECTQS